MLLKRLYDKLVKKANVIQTIYTIDLVRKADYNTKNDKIENKITDHDKYITTEEFNGLMVENFGTNLKEAKLATKDDITDLVKTMYFDKKK